jgi:hypothetical protein
MKNEIKPTYVTWEQAKWIKEKGFIEPTLTYWSKRDGLIENEITLRNHNGRGEWGTSRPEQHVVVEWLRINHGIWITIDIINNLFKYKILKCEGIVSQTFGNEIKCSSFDYNSPQEAYSEAFDYIRKNNLI